VAQQHGGLPLTEAKGIALNLSVGGRRMDAKIWYSFRINTQILVLKRVLTEMTGHGRRGHTRPTAKSSSMGLPCTGTPRLLLNGDKAQVLDWSCFLETQGPSASLEKNAPRGGVPRGYRGWDRPPAGDPGRWAWS